MYETDCAEALPHRDIGRSKIAVECYDMVSQLKPNWDAIAHHETVCTSHQHAR